MAVAPATAAHVWLAAINVCLCHQQKPNKPNATKASRPYLTSCPHTHTHTHSGNRLCVWNPWST